MKRNRLIIAGLVVLVLLMAAVLLTACNHEHEILKWKTTKEPTCTTEGVERGVCVDCGEVVERGIPTVADNHVWGEWEVTVAPSYNRDGKGEVTRFCLDNSEHKQSVTLPKLSSSGAGYKEYELYEEPTVVSEGKLSAVLESEYGDISFTVNVPTKEFDPESIEDAVYLGSSNKDMIRKGNGVVDIGYNDKGGHNYSHFNYEYGTDYTHVYDAGNKIETWYSLSSSGDVFGYLRYFSDTEEYKKNPNSSAYNLNGYHYTVSRADKDFYGAEGLLLGAYQWGKKNSNKDYQEGWVTSTVYNTSEQVVNPNGEKVYWFNFGYYSVPQYYCLVQCRFMLTDDGALKYIVMYVYSYSSDQFEITMHPETNDAIVSLKENCGNPIYNEVVEYRQELKSDYPDEPEHEYTEESFNMTDFKITYKSGSEYIEVPEEIGDNTPSFMTGGGSNVLALYVKDIIPSTATFDDDPLKVYWINENGRRTLLDYAFSDSMTVTAYVNESSGIVQIRSRRAGYLKLAFVTESGYEKIITVHAEYSSPSKLMPAIYEYSDAGYIWKTTTGKEMTAEVYAGQSLTMKAQISDDKILYVDGSYVAEIESGPDENATVTPIEDSDSVRFVANTPGEYVVKMRSVLKRTVVATVTVTVNPAPSAAGLMTGDYTATMKKFTATISFSEPDTEGKIYATIKTDKATEILYVYYDEQYNVVRSEHYDGANLGTSIELNEAYKLVFVNPTGFGSGKERAILYAVEPDEEL